MAIVKRNTSVSAAADTDAVIPPEADAPPKVRGQALSNTRAPEHVTHEVVPSPLEQGAGSLREILARQAAADGDKSKPKAEDKPADDAEVTEDDDEPEELPPEAGVSDDPDAQDPDAVEAETPAAAKRAGEEVVYLTAAQRAEMNSKLAEGRRKRELETELKRTKDALDEARKKIVPVETKSRAEQLEDLLLGSGGEAAADPAMTPAEQRLKAQLDEVTRKLAERETRETNQSQQAQRGAAIEKLRTAVVTEEHFPMIAALGQYEAVMAEAESLYDAADDDGNGYSLRLAQVAADNVEQKLRKQFPAVASKVIGAPAAAAGGVPASGVKPVVGARANPRTKTPGDKESMDDLPYDETRHAAVKARFFGKSHR